MTENRTNGMTDDQDDYWQSVYDSFRRYYGQRQLDEMIIQTLLKWRAKAEAKVDKITARIKAIDEGLGKVRGEAKSRNDIACNMLAKGYELYEITCITHLSVTDVRELAKKHHLQVVTARKYDGRN